jgi:hypothetical protein
VVVHCTGSTYRKAGALALVEADGSRLGVISGGCLESDLAQLTVVKNSVASLNAQINNIISALRTAHLMA